LYRFREYLRKKYHVSQAFYFLGCIDEDNQDLYNAIQDAGFILIFRAHSKESTSHKKGNVDTDIVFSMMKTFNENPKPEDGKIFLVSVDGDYCKTIKYLKGQNKLGKVLFPARRKASSLYRQIGNAYYDFLDNTGVRRKIEYKNSKSIKKEGLRLGS